MSSQTYGGLYVSVKVDLFDSSSVPVTGGLEALMLDRVMDKQKKGGRIE